MENNVNFRLHQLAQKHLVVVCVITVWSRISHPLRLSQFPQFLNREEYWPCFVQDLKILYWKQENSLKKHYWKNQVLLVPSLNKILKALVLQTVVKVRNISEFQRRGLLFGFLLGSFSSLGCSVPHWICIIFSYSARMHQRQAPTEGREITECSWLVV